MADNRPLHPLPAVTDPVYEIIVKGISLDGGAGIKPCMNVFYYRQTTVTAPANKTSLKTIFGTTVMAKILLAANQRYTPVRVAIRNIQNVADLSLDITMAGAGARVLDSLPSDDAVCCILTSATRGKMCMGRKHFGMASEEDTTDDILVGGLARWQAVRDSLFVVMTDADANVWTPFILSRSCRFSSLKAPVGIYGANCTGAKLILNIGTMKRRRTKTSYAA